MSREETTLIELYEFFCPNADQYGLAGRSLLWDRKAVNARLEKLSIASKAVPDRVQRAWLGLEDEESSKNEHSRQEEQPSLLEQAFGAFPR